MNLKGTVIPGVDWWSKVGGGRLGLWQFALVLGLSIAGLGHAIFHGGYVIDDAFISFRYAENLVSGNGLVFNIGDRVEGYSNFVWTVAIAFGLWLGFEPVAFSRGIAYACGVAVILLTWKLSLALRTEVDTESRLDSLLPPLGLMLWCPFVVWMNSGLETILFALLLLVVVERFLSDPDSIGRRWHMGLALGVLGATRPEGFGYLLLVAAYGVLFDVTGNRSFKSTLASLCSLMAGALVILVPLLLWRWSYYGELLPNTVFAKSSTQSMLGERSIFVLPFILLFREGSPYIWKWIMSLGYGLPVFFACMSMLYRAGLRRRLVLFVPVIGALVVAWWNAGDWMSDSRLLVPVTPLVLILALEGLREVRRRVRAYPVKWLKAVPQVIVLITMVGLPIHILASRDDHGVLPWVEERMPLGQALAEFADPDELIATSIAGSIPYYSRLRTVDVLGLNDKHIARNGEPIRRWGKVDWGYVLSRSPGIWHATGNEVSTLLGLPEFREQYLLLRLRSPGSVLYACDQLFVRRDSASLDRLKTGFSAEAVPAVEAIPLECVK